MDDTKEKKILQLFYRAIQFQYKLNEIIIIGLVLVQIVDLPITLVLLKLASTD